MNSQNRFQLKFVYLILLGVGLLAFGPGLRSPFLYDDIPVLRDNHWLRIDLIPNFFRSFFPTSSISFPGYRPLVFSLFSLEHFFFGISPAGYRLISLLLHVTNATLVFLLGRQLLRDDFKKPSDRILLGAALLFLVHPIQTSVLALVWKRTNLLATLGILGALLCYQAWVQGRSKFRALLLGHLCAAIALCSKESALILPAILLAADLTIWKRSRSLLKHAGALYLPLLLLCAAHLWIFFFIFPTKLEAFRFIAISHHPPSLQLGRLAYLQTQAAALLDYFRLLMAPDGPGVMRWIDPVRNWADPRLWMGGAIVSALLGFALSIRRKAPLASFLIVSFFLFLVPASSLIPLNLPMDEDRLYLPMIPLALGVALLWHQAWSWATRHHLRLAAGAIGFAPVVALLLYVAQDIHRIRLWRSPTVLWTEAVKAEPNDPRVWLNFAEAQADADHYAIAIAGYERAMALEPGYGLPPLWLGQRLVEWGRVAEARPYLERAARSDLFRGRALAGLGLSEITPAPTAQALRFLLVSLWDEPNPIVLNNLSLALRKIGEPGAADRAAEVARGLTEP